jgi:hypothetical protein
MRWSLIVLLAFMPAMAAPAASAQTRSDEGTISIMREEGAPPVKTRPHGKKHRVIRRGKIHHALGSSNPVYPAPLPGPQKPRALPHYRVSPPQRAQTPPPLLVPQTGRFLPNLPPSGRGLGSGGTESFQQRAARCHQQAAIYGQQAGSPSTYINSCINQ